MPFRNLNITENNKERVNEILEVVMAYARLDFTKKTSVIGNEDILDAIGAGLNMLGEELESSTVTLKEKEQLLKEVHHRVKNNLQIISSLLNLQSDKVLDKKYLDMITVSRNRINSMAIVHEMLYASKDLSKIEIGEYIERLCKSIDTTFSKPDLIVQFHFNIEKQLFFDIDHMISLGLILNEIISNSFKYAFKSAHGDIFVTLRRLKSGYELNIKDNGIGLSENFDPERNGHLGMQLIMMLSKQMDGIITTNFNEGTSYTITFP
jgi:two-component sensor histidine kinase